uniref:WAK_assoc domain-containing protein n=1 Tax=Heterorhabditis bacteriophora TaxID=37862 RepID=A0A1I7WDC4_HETBA
MLVGTNGTGNNSDMVLNIRGDGKGISILTPYSYNHSIERYCGLRLYCKVDWCCLRRNVNFLWFDGWFVKIVVSDQESICDLCNSIGFTDGSQEFTSWDGSDEFLVVDRNFVKITGGSQELKGSVKKRLLGLGYRSYTNTGEKRLLPTYLIDSVSTKPCMYCSTNGETANADIIYSVIFLDNCGNSGANTCINAPTSEGVQLLEQTNRPWTYISAASPLIIRESVCPINLMVVY